MDFNFNKMTACDEPFYGVVPGKVAYPIGRVCLPVTFGTHEKFRTEYLTFEVADFRSSYHAILGRPMLAKFMAIPHHTYLIMKMPVANRILSVLRDIMVSYNYESSTVALAKDFAWKAAAMVMVAQAAKIDQTTMEVPEQKHTSTALDPSLALNKVYVEIKSAPHAKNTTSRISWLNTRGRIRKRASQFSLKLTKDENRDKTWNLPGGTRQFCIFGYKANQNDI
jgi:hypothetical protein